MPHPYSVNALPLWQSTYIKANTQLAGVSCVCTLETNKHGPSPANCNRHN